MDEKISFDNEKICTLQSIFRIGIREVKKASPYIVTLLLLGLVYVVVSVTKSIPTQSLSKTISFSEEGVFWTNQIKNEGDVAAWNAFKKMYRRGYGRPVAHAHAHIFGNALFEVEGIKGAVVCDDSFEAGCQHAFFGRAIVISGTSVIPELEKVCFEKAGEFAYSCPHGIGHGLLEYLGEENLLDALKGCGDLTSQSYQFACRTGVFMEYDFHGMVDLVATAGWRTHDTETPFEPCDTDTLKEYANACYIEKPLWWRRAYKKNYSEMGQLCAKVQNPDDRRSCFRGIGRWAVVYENYNIQNTISACDTMPNREASLYCRARVMEVFVSSSEVNNEYPLLCQKGLSESEQKTCISEIHHY